VGLVLLFLGLMSFIIFNGNLSADDLDLRTCFEIA
jgi:hypothetical protein